LQSVTKSFFIELLDNPLHESYQSFSIDFKFDSSFEEQPKEVWPAIVLLFLSKWFEKQTNENYASHLNFPLQDEP